MTDQWRAVITHKSWDAIMFSYDAPHLSLSARILLGMYIINATYNVVFILYMPLPRLRKILAGPYFKRRILAVCLRLFNFNRC